MTPSPEATQNYQPTDRSLEMLAGIGLFVICTLLAAVDQLRQGGYVSGLLLLVPPVLVMVGQFMRQIAHQQQSAAVSGDWLTIRRSDGSDLRLSLSRIQQLGVSSCQQGWRAATLIYWVETQAGDRQLLFAAGTFQREADLLRLLSQRTGLTWPPEATPNQ